MEEKLSDYEREGLIQWCALFSGYAAQSFYNLSDQELKKEYDKLEKEKNEKIGTK